jgi:hypothetical protein
VINGRDQTKLIQALDRQVGLVRTAMEQIAPDTPTRGALCFVDTDLPLVRTLTFNGYPLLYPRALAKQINRTSVAPSVVRSRRRFTTMALPAAATHRLPATGDLKKPSLVGDGQRARSAASENYCPPPRAGP